MTDKSENPQYDFTVSDDRYCSYVADKPRRMVTLHNSVTRHRYGGFAQIDIHEESATFEYLVYDPSVSTNRVSLGTFAWLSLVHRCAGDGIKYMYVGPWIKDSPTMGYKSRYSGLETFVDGEWIDFAPKTHSTGPDYNKITLDLLDMEPGELRPLKIA